MSKTLEEVLDELPPARRRKVERRAQQLIQEQLTLQELRKKMNLTQDQMADLLEMQQANISKVEKRSDMLISTLRGYVEALGGRLELVVRMPGREPVRIEGFE